MAQKSLDAVEKEMALSLKLRDFIVKLSNLEVLKNANV
jgi:hypothetical protein